MFANTVSALAPPLPPPPPRRALAWMSAGFALAPPASRYCLLEGGPEFLEGAHERTSAWFLVGIAMDIPREDTLCIVELNKKGPIARLEVSGRVSLRLGAISRGNRLGDTVLNDWGGCRTSCMPVSISGRHTTCERSQTMLLDAA